MTSQVCTHSLPVAPPSHRDHLNCPQALPTSPGGLIGVWLRTTRLEVSRCQCEAKDLGQVEKGPETPSYGLLWWR